MKQFIVLCAVLPVILLLLIQLSLEQLNSSRIATFDNIVYSAKERAQLEGCFSPELVGDMRSSIEALGFSSGDISIECDTEPKERGEYIFFCVSVKIRNAMVLAVLTDDSYSYSINSCAVSEYIK